MFPWISSKKKSLSCNEASRTTVQFLEQALMEFQKFSSFLDESVSGSFSPKNAYISQRWIIQKQVVEQIEAVISSGASFRVLVDLVHHYRGILRLIEAELPKTLFISRYQVRLDHFKILLKESVGGYIRTVLNEFVRKFVTSAAKWVKSSMWWIMHTISYLSFEQDL